MTPPGTPAWEHFEHMADIGVRGYGETLEEAFAQAAVALSAIVTEPDLIRAEQAEEFRCAGNDTEFLLLDWLNALIFAMSTRHLLFGRFDVRIAEDGLQATAWGEPIDRQRHHPAVEPKGATLTELKVYHDDHGRWVAQDVIDV